MPAIAGFTGPIRPCSADPGKDGYHVTWEGLPFHVTPDTPLQWGKLQEAIGDGRLKPVPFSPAVPSLDEAKEAKILALYREYKAAPDAPVSYITAGDVSAQFSRDESAVDALKAFISLGEKAWLINAWLDVGCNVIAPFTFADLEGLLKAIEDATVPTYQQLIKAIGTVKDAKKLAAIEAVTL